MVREEQVVAPEDGVVIRRACLLLLGKKINGLVLGEGTPSCYLLRHGLCGCLYFASPDAELSTQIMNRSKPDPA